MHSWWVCAKGRGDYLQQVHLRIIFHSSNIALLLTNKSKNRLVNSKDNDWMIQSGFGAVRKSKDGAM